MVRGRGGVLPLTIQHMEPEAGSLGLPVQPSQGSGMCPSDGLVSDFTPGLPLAGTRDSLPQSPLVEDEPVLIQVGTHLLPACARDSTTLSPTCVRDFPSLGQPSNTAMASSNRSQTRVNHNQPAQHSWLLQLEVCQSSSLQLLGCFATVPIRAMSSFQAPFSDCPPMSTPSTQIPVDQHFIIPAASMGKVLRHLNHSCDPSCHLRVQPDKESFIITVVTDVEA